jgi:ribose 5-phosphate isomerase B
MADRHASPNPYPVPSAEEVREAVRRAVEARLDTTGRPVAPHADPAAGAPAPAPGLATGAGAPAAGPAVGGQISIAIGADHGGFALKDRIGAVLAEAGYAVHDCGTNGPEAVDYPDVAHAVARLVADGACRFGIVVDGAGIGSCMVANKVPGVRAALCYDLSSARNSREHNHANVLTLGARLIGEGLAIEIVRVWLGTDWGPGRHAARVDKITDIEGRYARGPAEGRAG